MGMSTDAMLMYGYDLGSDESGWKVQQLNEDGELTVGDEAESVLLAAVGFTETDWRADGYHERMREAKARIGVTFERHCSADYPEHVIAAHVIKVYRGKSKPIDFAALRAQAAAEDWDGRLASALATLGLKPTQERPQWLLASYWG